MTLRLEYPALPELQADYRDNLSKGRAFVAGVCADEEWVAVRVVLARQDTGEVFEWPGQVVWICREGPSTGTGVELGALAADRLKELEQFLQPAEPEAERQPEPRQRNLHDRVRGLNALGREKMARSGTLPERVALERQFGGSVWEGLLQNPQLTLAEVVRIAKNGGLPKPLVNLIVSNPGWLAKPEVRRALLSNPRVDGMHLDRVLKATPRTECAQVARSTAYRPAVRTRARQLCD
jgi:hypothetical protein